MIERKIKICVECNKDSFIYAKKMCLNCYRVDYAKNYVKKHSHDNLFAKRGPQLPSNKKAVLLTMKKKIESSSTKNTYSDSNGRRWSKEDIDKKIKEAKIQYTEWFIRTHGRVYCVDCKKEHDDKGVMPSNELQYRIIDNSHTISVNEAQNNGMCELSWSWEGENGNIKKRCRFHHNKLDKLC